MNKVVAGILALLNNRRFVTSAVAVVVAVAGAFGLSLTETTVQGQVDTWTGIGIPIVTALVTALTAVVAHTKHPNQE